MSAFKFIWDTRKRLLTFNWNRLFSVGWEGGRSILRVLGIPIRFRPKLNRVGLPIRWFYIKNVLSFLTQWRLERLEGTISSKDPMFNGVLFGLLSAIEGLRPRKRFSLTINFLGKNNFYGQASIPPKVLFTHLKRWILPLFFEMREVRRKQRKEEGR